MKCIPLTKGKETIVDDDVFVWLSKHRCFCCGGGSNYAGFCRGRQNGKAITVLIHREVIKAKNGDIVDHINRNPLDNRRVNLRIASVRENALNSAMMSRSKVGDRGVYLEKRKGRKKCYYARIRTESGKKVHLGTYKTKKEASLAYEEALRLATKNVGL